MAPKKDKSKVEEEAVVNLSTGWQKSKMSESAVQELENLGLLQTQGVINGVQGKEKITLWKIPLKPLCSVISWNVALHFPCQNFSMLFCNSGESNCII